MKPPVRIVTLHRGWVFVGYLQQRGLRYLLDGYCIRRWGTDKGLGQLAKEGPRSETTLDPRRGFTFHEIQLIGTDPCDANAWRETMADVEVSQWDS